jgi:hypothetical protein
MLEVNLLKILHTLARAVGDIYNNRTWVPVYLEYFAFFNFTALDLITNNLLHVLYAFM